MRARSLGFAAAVTFVLTASSPARAAHHLWRVQQLYSNAGGAVQFLELETTSMGRSGETNVSGFTVVSGSNTFTFSGNLPASATTQWLLLGTSEYARLPGAVAPDFIIPNNFFQTGGGSIVYATGVDTWSYGTVPTDGVHALMRDPDTGTVSTIVNQPINFANTPGQVTLPPGAPALPPWAIATAVGALLLGGSGLLSRRKLVASA